MRVSSGRPEALELHLRRFRESARSLGISPLAGLPELKRWFLRCLAGFARPEAVARLMLVECHNQLQYIVLYLIPSRDPSGLFDRRGITVATSSTPADASRRDFAQIKSNFYGHAIDAILSGFDFPKPPGPGRLGERILLLPDGRVCEGTVSNVFIVTEGAVWTPPASCGILMGVTRRLVLRAASGLGIPGREEALTRHDLYRSEEMFLTNSVRGIVPVVRCDGRRIGSGRPGIVTRRIREQYRKMIGELV